MKNIIFNVIIIALAFCACNKKEIKQETTFKIVKNQYDVGKIKSDTIIKGYFIVENVGDSTIEYKNVITECGCTTMQELKGKQLIKGKSDTIYFTLDTYGMNKGIINKNIRIITNTIPDMNRFFIIGEII